MMCLKKKGRITPPPPYSPLSRDHECAKCSSQAWAQIKMICVRLHLVYLFRQIVMPWSIVHLHRRCITLADRESGFIENNSHFKQRIFHPKILLFNCYLGSLIQLFETNRPQIDYASVVATTTDLLTSNTATEVWYIRDFYISSIIFQCSVGSWTFHHEHRWTDSSRWNQVDRLSLVITCKGRMVFML